MLFKRKIENPKEMEKVITAEEKLDIDCQATDSMPTAGKLKRIIAQVEKDSESFFYDTVARRINGLIYTEANRGNTHIDFTISEVTTAEEREKYSFYYCYNWIKKYYALAGLNINSSDNNWTEVTYIIRWE